MSEQNIGFDANLIHVRYLLGSYPNNFTGTAKSYMTVDDYMALDHYLKKGFKAKFGNEYIADVGVIRDHEE